jgi:VWFA-related protein
MQGIIRRLSGAVWLVGLFCAAAGFAQNTPDDVLTRRVTGENQAAASQVQINQIDTSAFPKVIIFATVSKDGVPLKGLGAPDFRVREDEVDQEPLTVVPKLSALSVVVAIDTSGSMTKALSATKSAAKSFVDALAVEDRALVLGFARSVNILSPFSVDRAASRQALDSTSARGDTALYDALYRSVEALKDQTGRKAVVLLSDGVDDDGDGRQLSAHSVQEVLDLAKQVNVPIFTIGLGAEMDESVLKRIAAETGASYFKAPQAAELTKMYESIGQQLSGQYMIHYTSNLPGDGSVHRVKLSAQGSFNTKEYVSPGQSAVKATLPVSTPAAAVSVTKEKVVVKFTTVGVGAISIPALKWGDIEVRAQESGKYAGRIRPKETRLEVPAGKYDLEFGSYKFGTIEVSVGKTTEVRLGAISVANLTSRDITVREQESGQWAGTLRPSEKTVELPAGVYELEVGGFKLKGVKVAPDETAVITLGAISIPNLTSRDVAVREKRSGQWAGTIRPNEKTLQVPAGVYELEFGGHNSDGVQVSENNTTEFTVGAISIPNLTGRDVAVRDQAEGKWVGTLRPGDKMLEVPPGRYKLEFDNHTVDNLDVNPNQEVQLEASVTP